MCEFSFRIVQEGVEYTFQIETIYDGILNETYYCVEPFAGMRDYSPFLMVWDFELGKLTIQGAVPYFVRELSEEISESIEHYHLGEGL